MQPELKTVVTNFRQDQELALEYLHGHLGIPVPCSNIEWASRGRKQIDAVISTICDDGVQVRKHGYGIELIHPDFQIDFDYGPSGECDCFDAWRLGLHKHISLRLPDPVECDREIREWIADAVRSGELQQVAGRNSFYVWPASRSEWQGETQNST